jgi:hypothetical protein
MAPLWQAWAIRRMAEVHAMLRCSAGDLPNSSAAPLLSVRPVEQLRRSGRGSSRYSTTASRMGSETAATR